MIPIILSGGSGSRLWPLSRSTHPKQFLSFTSEKSLFQETCLRLPCNINKNPIIICNNEHRFTAAHQLQEVGIKPETIILEPVGRNTAPAIAIAALFLEDQRRDEIMLILPADHLIQDNSSFHRTLETGEKHAKEGKIVTLGVIPTSPETGYGYIHASCSDINGSRVLDFKEKPDSITAKAYIEDGSYYWNSGMFMLSSSTLLKEMEIHAPDILNSCKEAFQSIKQDNDFLRLDESTFGKCRSESIDFAVMEKTKHAYVIPLDAGWSDLGAWSAVLDIKECDEEDNAIDGDVIQLNCKRSFFYSDNKLIAAIGLEDMIVVDTPDALLISPKDKVQQIKTIVEKLKFDNRKEADIHRLVHRPWGFYDNIDVGQSYQVKRITVYPGEKLSVQKHQHRAEHWVVVNGKATVTCNEKTFIVNKNESTYIPLGSIHSLENKESTLLELIEIQSGDYLGEDDIIRFEDLYGRETKQKTKN